MNARTNPELTEKEPDHREIVHHEPQQDDRLVSTEGDFVVTPQRALMQLEQMQQVVSSVMRKDEHYGIIPGTQKPTLLKPGAELLNNMYGYRTDVEILDKTEQWDVPVTRNSFPLFRYIVKVTLYNRSGEQVASGVGECNSYEKKYRYRQQNLKCPACGKESIIQGKKEYGGGWLCFKKKGGCGAKYQDEDTHITGQTQGQVNNEAIFDQINTIIKMAKKRSYVDATLSATRTSGLFTQDVEDMHELPPDVKEQQQVVDPSEEKSKTNLSRALKKIPTAKDWQELEQIKLHADKLYNAGDLIKADLDKISEAVAARLEQLDKKEV